MPKGFHEFCKKTHPAVLGAGKKRERGSSRTIPYAKYFSWRSLRLRATLH